jgi:hypothetical protein
MDNFDAHKWFKKEYLGEGHTEDKVVAKGDDIEITQKQMERLHNGEVVRLSNGSVLSFVKEGHTEDKTERDQAIRRYDQLSDDDKLKLAKIQKMMDRERSLREDDLDEIAFGAAGTDKRTGQVVGEIIELIISTGVDVYEVMEELGQEFGMDVRP